MHEHRTADGKVIYYMSRADLERLQGYRGHGDRYRARCPVHGGDSFQAFTIDYATGWGHCFKCGDAWSLRVEDHPDTILPKGHPAYTPGRSPQNPKPPQLHTNRPPANQTPPQTAPESPQSLETLKRLYRAIAGATGALRGSRGAAYLESRGIDLQTALDLDMGWTTRGDLANRVVFPLSGPDGLPTGATGRAVDDHTKPKYRALAADKGYRKYLFNGGAISQAKRTGHPLLIVEGPLDAAAAYAAGYPLTVALGSTSYAHWDHFAGVPRAILLLDNDPAGIKARARAYEALQAYIGDVRVFRPDALATVLEGCNDLGAYWQRFHRMPPAIAAAIMGPHMHPAGSPARPGDGEQSRVNSGPDHPQATEPQNDNPMKAEIPHGSLHTGQMGHPKKGAYLQAANDNPMQSGNPHAIALTGPVVRTLFAELPPALQVEARALAVALQADGDLRTELQAAFSRNYDTLEDADRVAFLWAYMDHRPADLETPGSAAA